MPDVWRRTGKTGKPVGVFFSTIGGEKINLGTRDRAEAKKLAREHRKKHEDAASVEALAPDPPAVGADETPPASSQAPPGPEASAEPHANGTTSSGWAADLNDAAGGEAPGDDKGTEVDVDDLDLDELVNEGAKILVELQCQAQAYAWRAKQGIEVGAVPEGHLSRQRGERLWKVFLRRIMPTTIKIPTWVLPFAAVGVTAGPTTIEQMKGARRAGSPPAGGTEPIDVEAS